jgi:hypothetical protein
MLERLPPELGIFVFDLDVTVFNFDVPLEKWAERADVVLYERENNHEVAAGNYFVRNTPFARRFLLHWASYNHRRPTGFSSSDNGGIHLALLDALQLDRAHCSGLYERLEALVDNLEPYWEFVRCAKAMLHPPRRWDLPGVDGLERITILPRAHAWVADGYVFNLKIAAGIGPVFFHGIKEVQTLRDYFDAATCASRPGVFIKPEPWLMMWTNTLQGAYLRGEERLQYRNEAVASCASTLSCEPLDDAAELDGAQSPAASRPAAYDPARMESLVFPWRQNGAA